MQSILRVGAALGLAAAAAWSCSSDESTTVAGAGGSTSGLTLSTTGTGGSGTGGTSTASSMSTGGNGCVPVACETDKVYACADCLDNDGDGKNDADDPDCLGPCHNNESGFDLLIPGAGNPPCKRDCYFDKDSGAGNDDCDWDIRCDPKEPQGALCPYEDPPKLTCPDPQSTTCHDVCGPLTPNGCDCFGCCELPAGTGKFVFIGSTDDADTGTCTLDAVDDEAKCHPCTPLPDCLNGCDKCELCLGKTTLPPECLPDEQCPEELQACGLVGQAPCPAGAYCITGCCQFKPT